MAHFFEIVIVLSFAFASVLGTHKFNLSDERINEDENERIIGGRTAEEGQFPYAVALYYNGQFICTASIISDQTVLTAAHCVVLGDTEQPARLFYAVAGQVNRSSSDVIQISFSAVTVHPDYNGNTLKNDIAYFRTTNPIMTSDRVQPVSLATPDTPIGQYRIATAMGWGRTSRISNSVPDTLQYVDAKVANQLTCVLRYRGSVSNTQLCMEGLGRGICDGDSGGPLVHISSNNPPVQIGIASFVNSITGCGSLIIGPGVFTRVSAYSQWIRDTSGDNNIRFL